MGSVIIADLTIEVDETTLRIYDERTNRSSPFPHQSQGRHAA
jgi:hypothetical protein